MKYLLIIAPLLCFIILSCDKDDNNRVCYSFDVRQCQTDEFADSVPESESEEMRELKMKQWLDDEGFDVKEVKLVLDFHNAVCEACDTCPQGDRYYIQVTNADENPDVSTLRLLNYVEVSCDEFF